MSSVRILRILEYTGDLETIMKTLARGGVPANGEYSTEKITIKSGIVGFPEFHYPPVEIPEYNPDTGEHNA